MFRKLLIANRGEIACRIMRTAARLGVRTVAVYSDADRDALHTQLADEAWPIGPAPAAESYLSIPRILAVALDSGADGIHPGYGFLSENAEFAECCDSTGLTFVGPPAAAIRAMGSKAAAKALMAEAGVPLVPGYHGEEQDEEMLAREADRIGYPVLVKASAGGGGRGMRVVTGPAALPDALAAARREALAAFGDDRLLLERYLDHPRHIEVQIFADRHGNAVHLFERDCSIQRRHQKLLEEAPAPHLSLERRAALGAAALTAVRAVGYVGAGTVEFIADGNGFHFMEMNTRLQVEHPVTEMITGLDLVEWQLRVAAGEPLPLRQEQLVRTGHAIEVRICAEDPTRNFLPQTGTLLHLREPPAQAGVRLDTGVRALDRVTSFYDPMMAKLIAWGEDRVTAAARLASALETYEIVGVATNLSLFRAILRHPAFLEGDLHTGFLEVHAADLLVSEPTAEDQDVVWAAAALALVTAEVEAAATSSSPWALADGWRLGGRSSRRFLLRGFEQDVEAELTPESDGYRLSLPWGVRTARLLREPDTATGWSLWLDGVLRKVTVVAEASRVTVVLQGRPDLIELIDPLWPEFAEVAGKDTLRAPIPARVTSVLADVGQAVEKGQPLVLLEAMKTELTLAAPFAGTIIRIEASAGKLVEEGDLLLQLGAGILGQPGSSDTDA